LPRNYSEPPLCSDNVQNKETLKCQWCWCETLTSWYAPCNIVFIWSIWFFQFNWSSIYKARNFVFSVSSIYSSLWRVYIYISCCKTLLLKNFILCALHRLRATLLAVNHLLTWNRTQQNISTRIYATTVSSMNATRSDKVFILTERSLVYIMTSKGPSITLRKFCDLLFHTQKKMSECH